MGNALAARFARSGEAEVLEEAIGFFREAVRTSSADHPHHATMLSGLGGALRGRFKRTGEVGDLDEAIEICLLAAQRTPAGHPDRPARLNGLGNVLCARYERRGTPADLDEAIKALREAVRDTPSGHPDLPAWYVNLGSALSTRYARSGAEGDLDEAIEAGLASVRHLPADHADRPKALGNLGSALRTRFERRGAAGDLDEAVELLREAVRATPADHTDHPEMLANLGNALAVRAESAGTAGTAEDLGESVEVLRRAVRTIPADHPLHAAVLGNLGSTLKDRFSRSEAVEDLNEAVGMLQEAVRRVPDDQPDHALLLNNLGAALHARFQISGAAEDLEASVAALEGVFAAEAAAPSMRVQAGRAAGRLLAGAETARAAALLEKSVGMLEEVASRELGRGDQLRAVGALTGLAGEAAALILEDESRPGRQRAESALRSLEFGRARVMAQMLETRTDLSELGERHPRLADRFQELRALLDRPEPTSHSPGGFSGLEGGAARDERRAAAREMRGLLARIRSLDGFTSFAGPPAVEELKAQAGHGPVVTFNVTPRRSDALLLTAAGVVLVRLPDLSHEALIDQVNGFHQALQETGHGPMGARIAAQRRMGRTLEWLWDTAAGPVLGALGITGAPSAHDRWPRVWWAPGGLLGLLPLHAAGHHTDPPGPERRVVLDRVVSSYTPSIGALRHARRPVRPAPDRSLIVAMPTTPGLAGGAPLPQVTREAELLSDRLPDVTLLAEPAPRNTPPEGDDPEAPTRVRVFARLGEATVAHFACHGFNDPADPSRSRLLLHDHAGDPLTVASLAPLDLGHVRLAYLSACSTAVSFHQDLLDEAVHLTSGFQLAGFPHVVGTLWPINDRAAVDIADDFYAHLAAPDGSLRWQHAAHALHRAIRTRYAATPGMPSLWAAHLHAGA
ncbi:hypothetical protein GCM10022221_64900 [Actinocorallia aurea]